MKFTIGRSTWRCGINGRNKHGLGGTALLNHEGFRCCLGSVCSQLGVPDDKLLNVEFPRDRRLVEFHSLISILQSVSVLSNGSNYMDNTELASEAISINDNPNTLLADKEFNLIALFAQHGHELEFVGVYTHDKPDIETENEPSCTNQSTTD